MYDINKITLGETLKNYRKMNNLTLQEVGDKIFKSKVTICKYENNEIMPDLYTLLELCNLYNLDISQICEQTEDETIDIDSPFKKNKLYLYYYKTNKLVDSKIEIKKKDNKYQVKFFKESKSKDNIYKAYYEGEMVNDKSITYFELNNNSKINDKVQIIINIPWAENTNVYNGVYTGVTKYGIPIIKKVLVSEKQIKNFDKYDNRLRFSKEESKNIYKHNAMIFDMLDND